MSAASESVAPSGQRELHRRAPDDRRRGKRYPLPRRGVPKPLAVALALVVGLERGYLRRDIGFPLWGDTTKSRQVRGVRYRPARHSMEDMPHQLTEAGAPDPQG